MEFSEEIHFKLDELFDKYNLKIIEETKNYLELKSPYLIILLIYNPYEKSNNLSFVTLSDNHRTIEIDNEVLKKNLSQIYA